MKDARIVLDASRVEGIVAPELVSYTMDFWPVSRDPSFSHAGIATTANLSNPQLRADARGLSPAFLRIGGSLADSIIYLVPNAAASGEAPECPTKGLPHKCLSMERWEEILDFAQYAQARIVFCLNYVKHIHDETTDWDGTNAYEFLNYTKHHAPPGLVYGYELGNEPFHTKEKNTNVTRYRLAYQTLRDMVSDIWKDDSEGRPKIVGPAASAGGQFDKSVEAVGDLLDVITYHQYRGDGKKQSTADKAMVQWFFAPNERMDQVSAKAFENKRNDDTQLWLGEGAMAMHSGRDKVTNTFLDSFWYANQLAAMAKSKPMGHKVFCRQTLMGGNYGLVSHHSDSLAQPNPDYWVARIWKHLMGTIALEVHGKDCCKPGQDDLIAHAFCAKTGVAAEGDVALLLINIASSQTHCVYIDNYNVERSEYVLSSANDDLATRDILINGQPPTIGNEGEILSPFAPRKKQASDHIYVSPHTIMFAILHNVSAPSCLATSDNIDSKESATSVAQSEEPATVSPTSGAVADKPTETTVLPSGAPSLGKEEAEESVASLAPSIVPVTVATEPPVTSKVPTSMPSIMPVATEPPTSAPPTSVPSVLVTVESPMTSKPSTSPSMLPETNLDTEESVVLMPPGERPVEQDMDDATQVPPKPTEQATAHDGNKQPTLDFRNWGVLAVSMGVVLVIVALVAYKRKKRHTTRYNSLPADELSAQQQEEDESDCEEFELALVS